MIWRSSHDGNRRESRGTRLPVKTKKQAKFSCNSLSLQQRGDLINIGRMHDLWFLCSEKRCVCVCVSMRGEKLERERIIFLPIYRAHKLVVLCLLLPPRGISFIVLRQISSRWRNFLSFVFLPDVCVYVCMRIFISICAHTWDINS